MDNQTAEKRSASDGNATRNSQPNLANGSTSGADDHTETPPKPRGRRHPATATFRLKYGTKGRAKDAARERGMSLCAFVRQAVRDALARHESRHEKSPNAV